MAEKIIPFARTVLLPAGSPAIGCVDGVRMDVSGLQCQYTGQSCYCLGDADVLIEYHAAPADSGSLFAEPSAPGRAWQALLSLPVELACGSAEEMEGLPPGSYQPMLRHLEWFMVASNAVELEGSLLLSWAAAEKKAEPEPEPEAEAAEPEAALPVRSAAEQEEISTGAQTEQTEEALPEPEEEPTRGLILRPEKTGKGRQAYQPRGWTMINYSEEQTHEEQAHEEQAVEKKSAVDEQIQHLAETAEQTAAEARQLWKEIEERQAAQEEEPEEELPPETEKPKLREAAPPAEDSPPAVILEEDRLREAVSLSLSGESEADADARESELREGVVVRMRFASPPSAEQKRLYYPGPVPEVNADPKTLAEALHEALGEDLPRPSARVTFGWDAAPESQAAPLERETAPAAAEEGHSEEVHLEEAYLETPDPEAILFEESQTEAAAPEEIMLQAAPEEDMASDIAESLAEHEAGTESGHSPWEDPAAEEVPLPFPEAAFPTNSRREEQREAFAQWNPQGEKALPQFEAGPDLSPAVSERQPSFRQQEEQLETAKAFSGAAWQTLEKAEAAIAAPPVLEISEPPILEADQAAVEESLDAALEPEILPPAEKRSRRRRAVGLPRLHIDARDNTVEISAFNLQIKL